MPFKPNYNQQRAARARIKQEKKEAKLREREQAVAQRRAAQEAPATQEAPKPEDESPS